MQRICYPVFMKMCWVSRFQKLVPTSTSPIVIIIKILRIYLICNLIYVETKCTIAIQRTKERCIIINYSVWKKNLYCRFNLQPSGWHAPHGVSRREATSPASCSVCPSIFCASSCSLLTLYGITKKKTVAHYHSIIALWKFMSSSVLS